MRIETRTTDSKARLILPKSFANSTVIVEQISDTEVRIRRAKVVAEDDLPFCEEQESRLSDRDRDLFLKLLAEPKKPNAALKKAAARHQNSQQTVALAEFALWNHGELNLGLASMTERVSHAARSLLTNFLQLRVSQYEKRSLGRTFVAVPLGSHATEKRVLGYYTLAAGAVAFEHLPTRVSRRLPKHPVPVVLLGRLAVDKTFQGKGLGEGLLLDSLQRSLSLSHGLGVYAVKVDALDDSAVVFYKKYGFVALPDKPRELYMSIATIEDLFR